MLDSFLTNEKIVLQPGSSKVPYTFTFDAASSTTANDGSLPYGTTISSAVSKVFDSEGVDKTSEMIDSESKTDTVVTVKLKYPSIAGVGSYSLEILLTLSDGSVMEFDFNRIIAKDIGV